MASDDHHARHGQRETSPCCAACGGTDTVTEAGGTVRSRLATVPDYPGVCRYRRVCRACLGASLRRLGAGVASGHSRACIACSAGDPGRYAIAAIWPDESFAPLYWLACARHLRESLDALTLEKTL